MKFQNCRNYVGIAIIALLGFVFARPVFAQDGTGVLRGQVVDPSGAVVRGATVTILAPAGPIVATTNDRGVFEVKNLPPGKYRVQAIAAGFAQYEKPGVEIKSGQVQKLAITLSIESQQQKVVVSSDAPTLDVSPEANAGAIIITGKQLEALSDDPDELQADLQALAGPSAGPNGGQMYIDGFTAGQLPPKSSIREIRINQNPFSAQYDELGYGRIEIFTKPGTDKLHGSFQVSGNDSAFNSQNPFAKSEPPYESTMFSADMSGSLSKKLSFFVSAQRRDINDVDVVSAQILDSTFNQVHFADSIANPRTRTNISPRIDYQFGKNNTLSVRYQYWRDNERNEGVGQFALPSQGYNNLETEQTFQVSDTQMIGANVVNETRFQYVHDATGQTAQNNQPTLTVLGAFTSGGNNLGNISDDTNRYEFQNYTSIVRGTHFVKLGVRLRATRDSNSANSAFNGMFTFPTLDAYQTTEKGLAQGLTLAQIRALGGGPSQFSIIAGVPEAQASLFDAGLYAEDDWRVRHNVTLSYGLRFETQNDISDHFDWAPRVAIAWGIGGRKNGAPKTVLRAGSGIFYDRFEESQILQAARLNGTTQQQFVVTNPDFFPNIPPANLLPGAQTLPTVYRISPTLHAPATLQTAVTVERQLTKFANLSVSYLNSRGFDQLLTNNINTPLPGTYNPLDPAAAVRPFGNIGNIYEYQSEGIYRQNELIANVTVRAGAKLSLFGYYVLNYAKSNTNGADSFPSNPFNLMQDYGRAEFDTRNRVFMGGSVALPYGLRLSPFLLVSSGLPFNVTIGQDLIGSSQFNQRPALVSSATCSITTITSNIYCTPLGTFNTVPSSGEALVPINYGTGPGRFSLNLRLSKTFGFGKKPEGPGGASASGEQGGHRHVPFGVQRGGWQMGSTTDKRYNLTFSVSARNIFNHENLAPPVGVIGSSFFDQSNALAGGPFSSRSASRIVYLQASFSF